MEELQKRHRQEQKTVQARITQKKKSATKKTRKGINDECAALERDLIEQQRRELDALDGDIAGTGESIEESEYTDGVDEGLRDQRAEAVDDNSRLQEDDRSGSSKTDKRPNRQQVRKARKAAEQNAVIAQAKQEAADMPDLREQEMQAMREACQRHRLIEYAIRPDGHCLYAAIADQLRHTGRPLCDGPQIQSPDYKIVRECAAKYIQEHQDDFLPFLETSLSEYIAAVRNTGEWGGHLELVALAKAYAIQVNVLEANGHVENVSDHQSPNPLWLAYYHHSHGLGEHYNSLRVKS